MTHRPGLYVHVPFCARACPYCDFDFTVARAPQAEPLVAALRAEVDARRLAGTAVQTVYLGGGTPTSLGPHGLRTLASFITQTFDCTDLREWTVEVNPEHVDDALIDALGTLGVTRLSLGLQSMNDAALRVLGRKHRAEQAHLAIAKLATSGMDVSVDLMVGLPGQDAKACARDVTDALAHKPAHVSVYALTVEPGTPWARMVQQTRREAPNDDAQVACLLAAKACLQAAGFDHYEISNYARPGRAAVHNQLYWQGGAVIGLGPSAASAYVRGDGATCRRINVRTFAAYKMRPALSEDEVLAPDRAARESLWLALRQVGASVSLSELAARHRVREHDLRAALQEPLRRALVELEGDLCRLSPHGWLWHDAIGEAIVAPEHTDG